jgi:hypothetical protein
VTLGELLEAAADDLANVSTSPSLGGGVTWARGSEVFAALDGEGASADFRLDPAVAAAAARTPDTAASSRGPGWVSFRPATLDAHGEDRASAWFESAYRHAAGR